MPFVVGLTGGIACGKSTVAKRLVELGAELIDADVVAREVVAPGTPGLARICEVFGADMLTESGTLNRPKLGAVVFSDPAALDQLNALLHPEIEATIRQRVATSASAVVLVDAALLIEMKLNAICDFVLVVWADRDRQRDRLMARNALSVAEADHRIDAQAPHSVRLAAADVAIDNNAGLVELEAAVDAAWARVLTAAELAHATPSA